MKIDAVNVIERTPFIRYMNEDSHEIKKIRREIENLKRPRAISIGVDYGQYWGGPKGYWGASLTCGNDWPDSTVGPYRVILQGGAWSKLMEDAVWYVLKAGEIDYELGDTIRQMRLLEEQIMTLKGMSIPLSIPSEPTDDAVPYSSKYQYRDGVLQS